MKALVTGATGFIGRHLVESLMGCGYEIVCLVRDVRRMPPKIAERVQVVRGDLDSWNAVRLALHGVDVVFHLAGLTKATSAAEFFKVNYLGTRRLVAAALERPHTPRRFVLLSSLAAMGPCTRGSCHTETSECRPLTPYGRSKLAGEEAVRAASDRMPYTILRPPAVFGPGDRENLVFFKLARMGIIPVVAGGGLLSVVYVRDLVRAIVAAGSAEAAAGETLLVAYPAVFSWLDLATSIREAVNPRARIIQVPRRVVAFAGHLVAAAARTLGKAIIFDENKARDFIQDAWTCSTERAARILGFQCEVDLRTGMRETASWYRQAGWL